MDPPEYLVSTGQGLGFHSEKEELPEEPADRREKRQPWIGHELGIGDAHPFDDEAGQQDSKQQRMHYIIIEDRLQSFRLYEKTAHEKPSEHDQRNKAGHIEDQGKQFIEGPFEEHPVEDWLGEVNLGHDEKCADKEKAEAPEKEGMERAGPNTRST